MDFLARVQAARNVFLHMLSLKANPLQTKESLYMIAPLVRSRLLREVNLAQLEMDDDFIIELVETFRAQPDNPLQFICLGKVSPFGCEYITRNIECLKHVQIFQMEEDKANPFSVEVKQLLVENVKGSCGELLFWNVQFADASDDFVNRLIEVNEQLRQSRLEKEEEQVVEGEYRNTDLRDISEADSNRLCLSFSGKNYLESVFGDSLEKSIFEIKNYQEKQRKQKEKFLEECSDEPDFELDDSIFTSDGFTLLLCRKLIDKFGLLVECDDSAKENVG